MYHNVKMGKKQVKKFVYKSKCTLPITFTDVVKHEIFFLQNVHSQLNTHTHPYPHTHPPTHTHTLTHTQTHTYSNKRLQKL